MIIKIESDEQTFRVLGCAMEVHRRLGPGFSEAVYQEAMEVELTMKGIPYEREARLSIHYKGRVLRSTYKVDFLVWGRIVLELKAVAELAEAHKAQTINYMKAGNLPVGLLVNFSDASLRFRRLLNPSVYPKSR